MLDINTSSDLKTEVKSNFNFNPKDYYILVQGYDEDYLSFHEKIHPNKNFNLNKILKIETLTSEQRELLLYIKNDQFDDDKSSFSDPIKRWISLAKSNFPIFQDYYDSDAEPVVIDLSPPPLQVEIIYKPEKIFIEENKIRHDFFLRMPGKYWQGMDYFRPHMVFFVSGSFLMREYDNRVEIYQLTTFLINIISRLRPTFDYKLRSQKIKYYETRLNGKDIEKYNQLIDEAKQFLDLISSPPNFISQPCLVKPQLELLVDFDNENQNLQITPVVDYGIYKQDISEVIYISHRWQGDVFVRREVYENPGTHIVTVENNIIYYIKIDPEKELKFYLEILRQVTAFGFTKTLKCKRSGAKKIKDYFDKFWPVLLAYFKDRGYKVVFLKDVLALEQTTLRADFSVKSDTDKDWLYFDLSCYCGEEKITLVKLLAFLESGNSFWQREDGSLVEISNRQELEALARLLKNFHARENDGFEGRLYHASELEYVITNSKHYNLVQSKGFKNFLNSFKKGKSINPISIPENLVNILRPYQVSGIEWLYFLRSYNFAGILADDMGLGKTLQTLTILEMEKITNRPSLVVCPKTLIYNWKVEAEKFFPNLKTLVYDGTPVERDVLREKFTEYNLIISSYSTLKQDEIQLRKFKFNYMVLDEAQFIKNHASKTAQIVKKINTDHRLALTGTPMENNVSELWSIYDFLMPGFLGNYEYFVKHFHKPIMDFGDTQALKHLKHKVEYFMLRRTRDEVLTELPPKIESLSQCYLSEAQNILYQQILAKVRGDVFNAIDKKGFKSSQIHILAGLTKLRQACNHPILLIKDKDKDFKKYESTKLDMCLDLVETALKNNSKILIFSQFTQMLDIVSSALKDKCINHSYLSGKTKNRQNLVDNFNADPAIPVFLISLKAGGTGLNLTAADTIIIFDPWWNPSVENQAIGRAYRIGQIKPVNVYRLLSLGTIEEKIQVLKEKKQILFDSLINESSDTFTKLTWDDVRELFTE